MNSFDSRFAAARNKSEKYTFSGNNFRGEEFSGTIEHVRGAINAGWVVSASNGQRILALPDLSFATVKVRIQQRLGLTDPPAVSGGTSTEGTLRTFRNYGQDSVAYSERTIRVDEAAVLEEEKALIAKFIQEGVTLSKSMREKAITFGLLDRYASQPQSEQAQTIDSGLSVQDSMAILAQWKPTHPEYFHPQTTPERLQQIVTHNHTQIANFLEAYNLPWKWENLELAFKHLVQGNHLHTAASLGARRLFDRVKPWAAPAPVVEHAESRNERIVRLAQTPKTQLTPEDAAFLKTVSNAELEIVNKELVRAKGALGKVYAW